VRTTESFRQVCGAATDLEHLLCHAMDWMLRHLGYANLGIWLASDEGHQLGAYMKYTIPGEAELTGAMKDGIVNVVNRQQFIHLEGGRCASSSRRRRRGFFRIRQCWPRPARIWPKRWRRWCCFASQASRSRPNMPGFSS